jgi:hypothetical protein
VLRVTLALKVLKEPQVRRVIRVLQVRKVTQVPKVQSDLRVL